MSGACGGGGLGPMTVMLGGGMGAMGGGVEGVPLGGVGSVGGGAARAGRGKPLTEPYEPQAGRTDGAPAPTASRRNASRSGGRGRAGAEAGGRQGGRAARRPKKGREEMGAPLPRLDQRLDLGMQQGLLLCGGGAIGGAADELESSTGGIGLGLGGGLGLGLDGGLGEELGEELGGLARGLGDEGGLSVDSTLGGEHLASTLTSVPLTTADPHLYIVPAPSAPTRKYI